MQHFLKAVTIGLAYSSVPQPQNPIKPPLLKVMHSLWFKFFNPFDKQLGKGCLIDLIQF